LSLLCLALMSLAGALVPRVIVDTDMSMDCDDVGALCILNALVDNGEAEILAVVHNTGLFTGVGAISVINHYYGRDYIPIGAYKGPFAAKEPGVYVDDLVASFPSPIKNYSQVPDAVEVYRRVLSDQPDRSVTIASIGFTTNLDALLRSPPDANSPLNGTELVAAKVVQIAWMGGKYPSSGGQPEWNFSHDGIGSSTKFTVENTPSLLRMFSGFEIGLEIMTGGILTNHSGIENPCRKAYIDHDGPGHNRPSWDPATTLYAVRGYEPFWKIESAGYNNVSDTGDNTWIPGPATHNQGYLVAAASPDYIAGVIDDLLLRRPKLSGKQ